MPSQQKRNKSSEKVSQVFRQAKASLKLLETLERETLARAKHLVKLPLSVSARNLRSERILASLKRLGVATQSDLDALKDRVERLEHIVSKGKESAGQTTPQS